MRTQVTRDSETGELMIDIPQEIIDQLGWKAGDSLAWTVHENGTVTISKLDEDSSLDETNDVGC